MNRTIKKKKSIKNKTQKKRVQRGGSDLHDNLKRNIKGYIEDSAKIAQMKKENISKNEINKLKSDISDYKENIKNFIQNATGKLSSEDERNVAKLYAELFEIVKNNKTNSSIMNSILQNLHLITNKRTLGNALKNIKEKIKDEQNIKDEQLEPDSVSSEVQKANETIDFDAKRKEHENGLSKLQEQNAESFKNISQNSELNNMISNVRKSIHSYKKLGENEANAKVDRAKEAERLKAITDAEEEARRKAEQEADKLAEEEARRKQQEADKLAKEAEKQDADRLAKEEARRKAEQEAKEEARRKAEQEAKEEARLKAEEEVSEPIDFDAKRKENENYLLKLQEQNAESFKNISQNVSEFDKTISNFDKNKDFYKKLEENEANAKVDRAKEAERLKAITDAEEAILKAKAIKAEQEAKEAERLKEEATRLKAEEDAKEEAEKLKAKEEARLKAEEDAKEEARLKEEEDAKEEARLKEEAEQEAKAIAEAEEAARERLKEEARLKAEQEATEADRLAKKEAERLKAEQEAKEEAEKLKEEARLKAEADAKEEADKLKEKERVKAKQEAKERKKKSRQPLTNILDENGLLPPIRHEKLKGLSNETKVLFSNRTFVYNLMENPNKTAYPQWLQMAGYLYTDLDKPANLNENNSIDITNPIIKKSFCYNPDDTFELDDLLTKIQLVDTTWVQNPNKVQVHEPSGNGVINTKPVEYIHYKRIY
jgi:trichohyalin